MNTNMLQCYNRGCGQIYDPERNEDDSCCHHPGAPFFHDAYKGWTCCNKKTVDFTEFLNTKGCTMSKHSNIKPAEPEKPLKEFEIPVETKVRPPIPKEPTKRPDFGAPLKKLTPVVAATLKDAIDGLKAKATDAADESSLKPGEIPIGTSCKNRGCTHSYTDTAADSNDCQYHPGVPIFHEGLKYWSCCQKKTTDFASFMAQGGCDHGDHKWFKDDDDKKVVDCRYDWHQTAKDVVVAIYAKMYHYEKSTVQVNPVRLKVNLVFPNQDNAEFNLDLELRGVIKVDETTVQMYGTKVEITMPKADAGSWAKLDYPITPQSTMTARTTQTISELDSDSSSDSDELLDSIEPVRPDLKIGGIS